MGVCQDCDSVPTMQRLLTDYNSVQEAEHLPRTDDERKVETQKGRAIPDRKFERPFLDHFFPGWNRAASAQELSHRSFESIVRGYPRNDVPGAENRHRLSFILVKSVKGARFP